MQKKKYKNHVVKSKCVGQICVTSQQESSIAKTNKKYIEFNQI